MEEIQKEIKLNEKYIKDTVSDHERLRFRKNARIEAERVKKDAFLKSQNEIKEFKKSKQGLLLQLVGTGQKREKVKDMSLGSEST